MAVPDYTAEKVRTLCASPGELRARWADAGQRASSLSASNGERAGVRCRNPQQTAFFNYVGPEAREKVAVRKHRPDAVAQASSPASSSSVPLPEPRGGTPLELAAGTAALRLLPDVLKVPPISHHGKVSEIIGKFGGADQLRNAVNQLQTLLYAA